MELLTASLDELAAEARRGTPIFLDTSVTGDADRPLLHTIRDRFDAVPRAEALSQLMPRR